MPEIKKFLYPHKVAEILDVDKRQVYRLISEGSLEAIRIGRRGLRVSSASLEAFISQNMVEPGYLDK